jgi:hypothetical protein
MVDSGTMAKVILNPAFEKLRGKVGKLYCRHVYGKPVFQCVPDFSRRKLTAPQQAHLRKLGAAAKQAKILLKDPQRRAVWAAQAKRENKPLVSVANRDCYRQMP